MFNNKIMSKDKSTEDILKNDRVVKMWKELKPQRVTKKELEENRIPAYTPSF